MLNNLIKNFSPKSKFAQSYYLFINNTLKITKPLPFFKVNFRKNWVYIFNPVKYLILTIFIFNFIRIVLDTATPFLLSYIFSSRNFNWLYSLVAFWFMIMIFALIINYYWIRLYSLILGSFTKSAVETFIRVDPIYHATKASGQILSKVDRARSALDDIIYLITEDVSVIFFQLITATGILFALGFWYGVAGLCLLVFLVVFGSWQQIFHTQLINPYIISSADKVNQIEVENLNQIFLIRSTFTSDSQLKKHEIAMQKKYAQWNLRWRTVSLGNQIGALTYLIFLFFLFSFVINDIKTDKLDPVIVFGSLSSFIPTFFEAVWIGEKIQRLVNSTINIKDTFDYIGNFGKQTYPVLSNENQR